jgi:carboxyl-terminal processing protease
LAQAYGKQQFTVLLLLTVLFASLTTGFLEGNRPIKPADFDSRKTKQFLSDFTEALDAIQQTYVENVGSDKLVYSAIKGMLRGLDPHSNFLDPKDFAKLREDQHSIYCGLGIQIHPLSRNLGRHVIVEHPSKGTPAERVGLRFGDVITHIENEPIDEWKSDDLVSRLRGPRGTSVAITIERPNVREPLHFNVPREEIPVITVPYAFELKPGIGYVKIDHFSETTAEELRSKLKQLHDLSALILDLRDNPGGLLNQAIEVADIFLHRGDLIVSIKGRMEASTKSYKSPGEGQIQAPLVVLINHQSASASEIVAGALQDHDRALIVGETSFGKGLVQTVYTLDNNTGLTLTTARYYTPSGRLIQRDYSGSNFEYYFMNSEDAPARSGPREVRYTTGNRMVLGGGGITPDIIQQARKMNRFERILSSKDVFFQYGRHLVVNERIAAGNPDSLEVNDSVLAGFRQFLRDRNITFSEEDIQANIEFINRRILQEMVVSSLGAKEGYKIGIHGDTQVLKALEMTPEAKTMMTSGKAVPSDKTPN